MIPRARRWGVPGLALTAVATIVLGFAGRLPDDLGLVLAATSIAVAAGMRLALSPLVRELSVVPPIAGLAVVTIAAPITFLAELVAGLGGVALLVWMTDDPDRPPGGLARGLTTVSIPGLAVGIAWSSGLLLPTGAISFGIAGGLLALVLTAVAFLTGRPELFDREEAATSYPTPR